MSSFSANLRLAHEVFVQIFILPLAMMVRGKRYMLHGGRQFVDSVTDRLLFTCGECHLHISVTGEGGLFVAIRDHNLGTVHEQMFGPDKPLRATDCPQVEAQMLVMGFWLITFGEMDGLEWAFSPMTAQTVPCMACAGPLDLMKRGERCKACGQLDPTQLAWDKLPTVLDMHRRLPNPGTNFSTWSRVLSHGS